MGTDKSPDQRFQEAQDGYKPVGANLNDLTGYGQYMCSTSMNFNTNANFAVAAVRSGPMKAFHGGQTGTVPEIVDLANMMQSNVAAFTGFLGDLTHGLTYIGNAAQVISDTYGGTDGASKANLESVSFAFGDPGSHRPNGLPKNIGQLQSEYDYEQQQKAGTDAEAAQADPSNYGDGAVDVQSVDYGGTGSSYVTYTYADGSQVTVTMINGTTTTTIYGVPSGNATQGKVLSSTEETYAYNSTTGATSDKVVEKNADGSVSSTTTTATDAKGNTDVSIEVPGDKSTNQPATTVTQHISSGDTPPTDTDKTPLQKEESQNGGMGHGDYGFIPSN